MRHVLVPVLLAMALLTSAARAAGPLDPIQIVPNTCLAIVPGGGAAGGDAIYCNGGDIIGPRNLQGGGPGVNFDIGAGSTEQPADLALNWDIGQRTLVYAGQKQLMLSVGRDGTRMWFAGRLLAWFGPRGIVFYVRPAFPGRSPWLPFLRSP